MDIIEQGKAALDANGDGKIEAKEVVDALTGRVKETAEAAKVAVEEVKKGFDADGDGTVSGDEVLEVVEAATGVVTDAFGNVADKIADVIAGDKE